MSLSTNITESEQGQAYPFVLIVDPITSGDTELGNSSEPEWGAPLMWVWESHRSITPRGNPQKAVEEQLMGIAQWASHPEDSDDDAEARAWAEAARRSLARWAEENPF